MKIIDRETFITMPEGTVFSEYEPCYFGPLMIKGATVGAVDWYEQTVSDAFDFNDTDDLYRKCDAAVNGGNLPITLNCETRNGMFDDDQLFAIWDQRDIAALITRLQRSLESSVC